MGCSNTKAEPKGNQVANGQVAPDSPPPEKKSRAMKGDLVQRKEAKRDREKKLKERRNKTVQKAELMSDRIMEERERLSLTGSRATSRAGTPLVEKKNRSSVHPLPVDNGSLPPSEVDEDNYNEKNDSIQNGGVTTRDIDVNKIEDCNVAKQPNGVTKHHENGECRTNNNEKSDSDQEVQNLSGVEIETADSPENKT